MSIRLVSEGPKVTAGIGEALGKVVSGPHAFLLIGDYGTGKTTFVQGLAAGLGIKEQVRSPSYNILKRYTSEHAVLVHADLYRTHSAPEIEELGIQDIVAGKAILAVEWPGRYLPPTSEMPHVTIHFSFSAPSRYGDEQAAQRRNFEITWSDNCAANVLEVLRVLVAR